MYDNRKILLTGDVGPVGLMEAAHYAYSRGLLSPPDCIQIPHQGSRRNVTPAVLNVWLGAPNGGTPRRGTAMVMVGAKKKDHPRKKVKNAFIRRGYPPLRGPRRRLDADGVRIRITRHDHDARAILTDVEDD